MGPTGEEPLPFRTQLIIHAIDTYSLHKGDQIHTNLFAHHFFYGIQHIKCCQICKQRPDK